MGECRVEYGNTGATYVDCFCNSSLCNNQTELLDLEVKNSTKTEPASNLHRCYACELDINAKRIGGATGSEDCFDVKEGPQFECLTSKGVGCIDTIITSKTIVLTLFFVCLSWIRA